MVAWDITIGDGPLVAAAIHNGHEMRQELQPFLTISDSSRLREEDPFTGEWTAISSSRIIGLRSRFEFDINRSREKAVYRIPEDCWGLQVWDPPLPSEEIDASLSEYDGFYGEVENVLKGLVDRYGRVVVYDLHSYNHRRAGPDAQPDDPALNPEVNLGTGSLNRQFWGPIADRFIKDLQEFDFLGRRLDVRENVKFRGGDFGKWVHARFPSSVCVLSIEFKKFFMDEWSGRLDMVQFDAILQALAATMPGVLRELQGL